jgi:hypothetical protein
MNYPILEKRRLEDDNVNEKKMRKTTIPYDGNSKSDGIENFQYPQYSGMYTHIQ